MKKVGENNGQLRFVRHHGWRTQAPLDQFFLHPRAGLCDLNSPIKTPDPQKPATPILLSSRL